MTRREKCTCGRIFIDPDSAWIDAVYRNVEAHCDRGYEEHRKLCDAMTDARIAAWREAARVADSDGTGLINAGELRDLATKLRRKQRGRK